MNDIGTIYQLVKLDGTNYTAAAGTSDLTSEALDTQGAEGVEILTCFGTVTDTAVTSVKLQQCDTSGGTYADLEGSSIALATTGDSNKMTRHVLFRPRERYIKVVIDRGTANAVVLSQVARFFGYRKLPATDGATVKSREVYASPAEGTA